MDTTGPGVVIGREQELAEVNRFLTSGAEPTIVVSGEPGVGKSTVWDACVDAARARGFRVLAARAAEPELQLSFVVLADLLAHVDLVDFTLSPPARRALEIAVLRADPDSSPPEPFAVATGLLAVFERLAGVGPTLIALDDVPWVDPASAEALCFVARRLTRARFVLARRPGTATALERALQPAGVRRVPLAGLSLGATRVLLAERLGLALPRRVLVRLHEVARGNPLFVLELGRAVQERGIPEIGAELPLPERVEDVFAQRISSLSPRFRRALLAVSLSGTMSRAALTSFLDPAELNEVIDDGLLIVEEGRVRPSHPLLAATARNQVDRGERREVHLALSASVDAIEPVRLRHSALATEDPDAELAVALGAAATAAVSRGAAHDAVELADHALRLTPADAPEHDERVLALAEYLIVAGESSRLARMLEPRLADLSKHARVRSHLILAEGSATIDDHKRHLDAAVAESGDVSELRALSLAAKAFFTATMGIEQLEQGEAWAAEAVRAAAGAAPDIEQRARHAVAVTRLMRGRPFDELVNPSVPTVEISGSSLDFLMGLRLGFRGHVAEARRILRGLLELADARGEGRSYALVQSQLCRIEIQAGMTTTARELLEEADDWVEIFGEQGAVWRTWLNAYLACVRGTHTEADRLAAKAVAITAESGWRGDQLDARSVSGLARLLNGDPAGAAGQFRVVWQHMEREGVDDPGVYPIASDLVEALVQLGEVDEAAAVTARLEQLALDQDHPWAMASAARCRGLTRSDAAPQLLARAIDAYEQLELRFDAERTRLSLGRVERRLRRWGTARRTLEQAVEGFERLGAEGWADEARAELARVGGRRGGAAGHLTPTEQQIAELAADGLSNKEIAARLVISVYTVERHLSHAYAKLGIRSRTQLGPRLGEHSV